VIPSGSLMIRDGRDHVIPSVSLSPSGRTLVRPNKKKLYAEC
jgi:hypothetical protein